MDKQELQLFQELSAEIRRLSGRIDAVLNRMTLVIIVQMALVGALAGLQVWTQIGGDGVEFHAAPVLAAEVPLEGQGE